jgi:hypothetical protein
MPYSPDRALSKKIAVAFLLLFPAVAFAEVSDKEPSLIFVWSISLIAAVICFFGAYFRKWLTPILAALPLLWFVSFFIEIHSEDIRLHLYAEQGLSYYVQSYLAFAILIFGILLGLFIKPGRLG